MNIAERGAATLQKEYQFSEPALADLGTMFDKAAALYGQALGALRDEDRAQAQEALHREAEVDHLEQRFQDAHLRRLDAGICQAAAGALYLPDPSQPGAHRGPRREHRGRRSLRPVISSCIRNRQSESTWLHP